MCVIGAEDCVKMANGGICHQQLRYDGLLDPAEFLNAFGLQSLMYKWTEDQQVEAIGFMLTGKAQRVVLRFLGAADFYSDFIHKSFINSVILFLLYTKWRNRNKSLKRNL